MLRLMMTLGPVAVGYVAAVRGALAIPSARWRSVLFAVFNVLGVLLLLEWPGSGSIREASLRMGIYGVVVTTQFVLTRLFARARGIRPWIAFAFPIVVLVLLKYVGDLWVHRASGLLGTDVSATFIGISFMAFRLSKLVMDVRNDAIEMPGLADFLGFAFFVPTMFVGPINPARWHLDSLAGTPPGMLPIRTCVARIVVGATKYLFLGGALTHLAYADLYLDGHPHAWGDFVVSAVAYYLYLYCNFSGFCDIVIGIAGLLRISVIENFRSPLLARNIKDFWSRWHISLSNYVREVLFNPISSGLGARLSPSRINEAIATALVVTFLATGVWHGVGWRYALFGLLHAAAMVVHHYYTLFLRGRLTRPQLKAYNENRLVRTAAVIATFAFVSLTFTVFANDWPALKKLIEVSPHLPEVPSSPIQ
jgi:D-alanyl-lipoteichoic acid acyltransferase DltB (MBOAT superfamily)